MRKCRTLLITSILTVLFLYLFIMPGAAEEPGEEIVEKPVAEINIGPYGISWTPKIVYAELILTVSAPDGNVISKTFKAGVTPTLDLSGINGYAVIDGSYTYELLAIPTAGNRIRESDINDNTSNSYHQRSLVQSGAFMVDKGKFVTSRPVAPGTSTIQSEDDISRTMDLCYQDDMVVQYSLCVGVDCVCNMNFGFDTIVLKENNLRIFFDDTSVSSGFPSNDWRLIANDSNSGGASYFSIEDATAGRKVFTVEAGAPVNSLYVDDGGRIGIGTSTPSTNLHVRYCNTPTLRLDQDSSCGWTAQAWDVAGNEANFFIRDVTNSSKLPFRIQPGTPENALTLKSDGKIGIGTWSPSFQLHMQTSGTAATFVCEKKDGTSGAVKAVIASGSDYVFIGSKTNNDFRLLANDSPVMTVQADGDVGIGGTSPIYKLQVWNDDGTAFGYSDGGAWATGSSRKFKENIKDLDATEAMNAFLALNPVRFNYIGEKGNEQLGFIAEDVPELVAVKNRDAVAAMDIVTLLTKVVQEQQKSINQQQQTISELKEKITKLENE